MTILIPIFGEQLSNGLSSLAGQDKKACVILMAEVDEETEYVPHHKSKMAYILSAMRHHAEDLRVAGWAVDYVKLTDAKIVPPPITTHGSSGSSKNTIPTDTAQTSCKNVTGCVMFTGAAAKASVIV